MSKLNILTPGEKIKEIREKLNIRQEDIEGEEITKDLIENLEKNKCVLTEQVAKALVININKLCEVREIDFSITKEYLLESVVSQAKNIADEYIQFIENLSKNDIVHIHNKLSEITMFLKAYETEEKKVTLYKLIAKRFMEIRMYSKAMNYYLKAYECSFDDKVTTNILIKLGVCCTYLSQYSDAINYYNLILELNNDIESNYIAKFNIALCYKKLGSYDEAVEYLSDIQESLKNFKSTHIKQYAVYALIAICLQNLKFYNKAASIYVELLKNVESVEEEVFILSNLANVYKETKEYDKLRKICNEIINKTSDVELKFINEYEGDLYRDLANYLMAMGDRDTALLLLLKALDSFKKEKSIFYKDDLDNLIIDILNIFIENKDKGGINFIKNEFLELIEKDLYPKYNRASLRFIQYYNDSKNPEEINELVSFLAI